MAHLDDQLATTLVDVCARNRKMELAETLFDDLFRNLPLLKTTVFA